MVWTAEAAGTSWFGLGAAVGSCVSGWPLAHSARAVSGAGRARLVLILLHAVLQPFDVRIQFFQLEYLGQYGTGRTAHRHSLLLDLQTLFLPITCHCDDRVILWPLDAWFLKRTDRRRWAPCPVVYM